jgi:hypothetical protein
MPTSPKHTSPTFRKPISGIRIVSFSKNQIHETFKIIMPFLAQHDIILTPAPLPVGIDNEFAEIQMCLYDYKGESGVIRLKDNVLEVINKEFDLHDPDALPAIVIHITQRRDFLKEDPSQE